MQSQLLESVLTATLARGRSGGSPEDWLERVVREPSLTRSLALWTLAVHSGTVPPRDELATLLQRLIAEIDRQVSEQLCAILHHRRFQTLEASWRGLDYLVLQSAGVDKVKIRILPVTWRELARDLERAIEFDQSQLFRKVYSDEFGTPGGEPFGVLLADFEISHRPAADAPLDGVTMLARIASVAAAAFCPFIAAAHPSLLDLEGFGELQLPIDFGRTFAQPEYLKWRALRDAEDTRF